ncbi:FecR family protein [Bradyrhizobium macuxiense]|uniref:FecR family protein n=1 Tax=Bradyrhizobium macuxiense TaxID=1755647 RepID=A0A560LKK0_9BRAD|nr:FecR domain-containing protein [Bradyrhizobium macuxiense]TWB96028.1 FecR family protein [Bradyrhizobium macuxiense]
MSRSDEPPEELTAIESEALARVQRLGSGQASRRDIEDTKRWGNQSSAHSEALAQASLLWDQLGPAGANLLKRRGDSILAAVRPQPRMTRRAVLGGALATSAAAYLVVSPPLQLWPSLRDVMADYRTAAGEQRKLTIDGDVKVTLNTGTSVNVQSGEASQDRIEILTGEAVIAAVSASREVRVVAGDGEMRARRAQFNVRHEPHSTCVTCLDGEVQVSRHSAVALLRAGQQVSYAALGLAAPMAVDPTEVTAWRDGMLIFHDAPLGNVVTEINRYRPGKVMVTNADLERRLVNGRFRIDNVDGILNMFQQIFGAKARHLPGGIVLLS